MQLAFGILAGFAAAFGADGDAVRVLVDGEVATIEHAFVEQGELWVPAAALPAVSGFDVKPMGLCSASQCIVVPENAGWLRQVRGRTYAAPAKIAQRLDQPVVADLERRIWAFGRVPSERTVRLEDAAAPDFALPDRSGRLVRLSDFRGKKVLLLTWASWCKCSLDLPRWQKVYEELRGDGFELVAVAQDSAGEAAAGRHYDDAKATFTSLIDPHHKVSALYQMVNVPSGVWIDEQGRIVRPPEVAYTKGFRLLGKQVGDDRYEPALRDWVARGEQSRFAMTPEQLASKLALRSSPLRRAELEFQLGAYLFSIGDRKGAREHWQSAQNLDPDNWNYHRQDWSFDSKEAVRNWMAKVRALGGKPYYEPLNLGGDAP
jgi:peroxiredoxin